MNLLVRFRTLKIVLQVVRFTHPQVLTFIPDHFAIQRSAEPYLNLAHC
jgi:hypothetical protein